MVYTTNTKGLTLIEVLAALLLLAVVLVPAFTLIHSCISSIYFAGDRSQLVAIGKGIMEETLASKDFDIKQHKSLTYSGNNSIKYDLSISYYQNNNNLRLIEIWVYISNKPDQKFYLSTIRNVK